MDKVIISDTSCLIALTKIDKLNVLKALYQKIIITKDVYNEFGGAYISTSADARTNVNNRQHPRCK